MTQTYGKIPLEKEVEKMSACRDIVQEIMEFGVNQVQIVQIIYLLSLELEDREMMLYISNAAKDVMEGNMEKKSELTI